MKIQNNKIHTVLYDGKTYVCNGERKIVDGQSYYVFKTKNGMEYDTLICLDIDQYGESEFLHLTSLPGHSVVVTDPKNDPQLLKFTAEENRSTIKLMKYGEPPVEAVLEYRTNTGDGWELYTIGDTITLQEIGDSVEFRGWKNGLSMDYDDKRYSFEMTGYISASGDVTSLINGVGGDANLDTVSTGVFYKLFYNCESLTTPPRLPSTKLYGWCYQSMFEGCTSLKFAPELPATAMAEGCYTQMFRDCSALTTAPELPATTLADYCYNQIFDGCSSITTAPELPATTLADYCYITMFGRCTSLVNAPELPATTLAEGCYDNMFRNCTSLVNAPELPATTLAERCYYQMFYGCGNLSKAPELLAETLVKNCYNGLFSGCSNLNYVKAMFTSTPGSGYTTNWLSGVSNSGTFVKNSEASWSLSGASGIPAGWTVETV